MGYYLQAFICKQSDASIFTENFDEAKQIAIGQELSLIPMTEELFNEVNNLAVSDSVKKFEYLTDIIETRILQLINDKKVAYVEAEYFGGEGGQQAIIWHSHKRECFFEYGEESINIVLKAFGVKSKKGRDEFDTLNLGRHRSTINWIEYNT